MKSFVATPKTLKRDWYLVDAAGQVLGRLAAELAKRLRGKHKPEFTPFVDTGDYIVVVNAEKIRVTGQKFKNKIYHWHTGYPGGLKSIAFDKLLAKSPEEVIYKAVKGMLPKNSLGRSMIKKLKVYKGTKHEHTAQAPKPLLLSA